MRHGNVLSLSQKPLSDKLNRHDYNGTQTHNRLFRKMTLNHLGKAFGQFD